MCEILWWMIDAQISAQLYQYIFIIRTQSLITSNLLDRITNAHMRILRVMLSDDLRESILASSSRTHDDDEVWLIIHMIYGYENLFLIDPVSSTTGDVITLVLKKMAYCDLIMSHNSYPVTR